MQDKLDCDLRRSICDCQALVAALMQDSVLAAHPELQCLVLTHRLIQSAR
jgi:hypothetical protein